MLRSVENFLTTKYVNRYGSLGIVVSRNAISWHLLRYERKRIIVDCAGEIDISDAPERAHQMLEGLVSKPELCKALTTVAFAGDLCRFFIARFDNLPAVKSDRERYIHWCYGKQYNLKNDAQKQSELLKIKILDQQSIKKHHVALSELSDAGEEAISYLRRNGHFIHSLIPLPVVYCDWMQSHASLKGKSILIVLDQIEWHYFWWEDKSLLFYRSHLWCTDSGESPDLLINGIQSVFDALNPEGEKVKSVILVNSEEKLQFIPDRFMETVEIYRRQELWSLDSDVNEPSLQSFWAAVREIGVG